MPRIDVTSFWIGFASAWLIVFVLWWLRKPIADAREALNANLRGLRERLTSGTESNWREDTFKYAQTTHLAGALFPLDEILLAPRFAIPQPPIDPTKPLPEEDLNAIIPMMPEWPELAAVYRAPTLSLEEALAGDDPVVILGGPGSGKTTVLAHLASRAALGNEAALFPGSPTPIFVHAADLELPLKEGDDVAQPLLAAAQTRATTLTSARLPRHLKLRLKEFSCVIFLDGFDELPLTQIAAIGEWLAQFRKQYPKHRLIAAAGTSGFGVLTSLGFAPLALAPWGVEDYNRLMRRWGEVWEKLRARHKKKGALDLDKHIVLGWLSLGNRGRTLAEVTLKTWAAFAGDARGNRPVDWLDSYVQRQSLSPNGLRALGKIALTILSSNDLAGVARNTVREVCTPILQKPDGTFEIDTENFLNGLIQKRLLVKQGKDRVNFRCGLVTAYCAATALAAEPNALPANRAAALWTWALYFLAPLGDLTSVVAQNLTQPADVLLSEPITCARWLRDAPAAVKWRNEVFRRLSKIALDNTLPENLRLRALSGFVAANDFAVAALFKQALTSADPFARRVAVLGLGALGDATAIPAMAKLFVDPYLDVRWAAALALATIGTEAAVQTLKQGLLMGDDGVKQACAQALGRHPELGHPVLKEMVANPDLGVRRAMLYGLAEVGEDWANKIIEDTQRNEQEWYVRNAANELSARIQEPPDRRPRPYLQPESQGWLVAWAAQKGMAVPPGKGAIEVLNRALKEGDEPARIAAAEALARLNDPIAARELYTALRDPSKPLVRDAAFRALAHLSAATGQRLSTPA